MKILITISAMFLIFAACDSGKLSDEKINSSPLIDTPSIQKTTRVRTPIIPIPQTSKLSGKTITIDVFLFCNWV